MDGWVHRWMHGWMGGWIESAEVCRVLVSAATVLSMGYLN